MGRRVGVVGAGMTRFVRRSLETGKELAWEAARTALESAELTLDDIDAVCIGSAPDAFDGVHMKGEYLADGSGGWNKPVIRSYVGGGTGVFCAIQGWYHVASGMFDRVLVVAEEKMSSTMPHAQGAFITIFDNITERPLGPNLLWIFALEMNRYMTTYGLDKADIARMAYDLAGITEPRRQIDVVEPYDPFDYKELHHLEGLLLFDRGKAPEAARDGVLERDGDLPSCPSGGLLGVGNPIAAAGLMKVAELFWQLRGEAGARQEPGTPHRGHAQAWGDLMQVGTVLGIGREA